MRKLLIFCLLALLATTATRAATTLTMSGITFTSGTGTLTGTSSTYTIYAAKNNGSTAPTYNTNNSDVRVYAKGTLQLSTTGDNMTQIVFNLSSQGKKRLAPITANTGTIATQASGDETVTWTGNASSVTFTVGDNADYGSEGSTKAGQLCFTSIVITEQGGTTPTTVDPPTFNLANGTTYTTAQTLEMSCATSGASIYYTTDGTTPTSASTQYISGLTYDTNGTYTVKAIAIKDGTSSSVATISFTIDIPTTTGGDVFELVTDAGNLSSGDDIIIVAVDNTHAMGAVSNSVGASATGFTLSGTQVTLDSSTDVVVYTLSGSTDAWALTNSNNSIGASSANLNTSGDAKWAITITDGVAKLVYDNATTRQLAYRLEGTTYNYFKHYATSNVDDKYYFNVKIYKRGTSAVTYPEVVGIAAFKEVASGTTVKLKLTDESNARVLHVESGSGGTTDAYVRDNSGAILFKGISPNRAMAYNQHLAGWIVGQYSVDATTGLPQFVPVSGTTNTDELVIADPVTEATTLPVEVEASAMSGSLADWATVKNIRMGGSGAPTITNAFGASGYSAPYSGALVDINGIVADGAVYPMTEDAAGYPLVTYVLDATQEFVLPTSAVSNVPVRWQRSFVADKWTPVTVPFAINEFDGTVMRYSSLSDGGITTTAQGSYATGVMNFIQASGIEAGVPYLVKTDESFSSMILDDITITTTQAQTLSYTTQGAVNTGSGAPARVLATGDTYSMVGTYSPTTVEAANTNKLVVGGDVVWANADNGTTVEGSSAYITTPKNQAIKLNMGSEGIITGIEAIEAPMTLVRQGTYNLLGMKMPDDWEALPPGIYIVNGKKVVKQ